MLGEVEGAVARVWRVRDPAECAAFKKSKVTLTDAAECLEPVSVPWWLGHKYDVHLRSMLRMTIRVLSASVPSHHCLILNGRTPSSPAGCLERSREIPPSFSSDYDDWARAIDHVESPQRSHSKRRTIWKGDPICQCKPIRSPLAQEPTNNKSSPPNGGAWRAVLPEPVSCNGGESLCSVSRRRNSSVQILSRF